MLSVEIVKTLPAFKLELNFRVDNDVLVLFGPSGCGKTTTLRCIAGLLRPDEGRIVCEDRVLYDSAGREFVPPRDRHVSYMFQDFALFPHMNVDKNIMYGVKKRSAAEADAMYRNLMEMLKIEHLSKRAVNQLSGGRKAAYRPGKGADGRAQDTFIG